MGVGKNKYLSKEAYDNICENEIIISKLLNDLIGFMEKQGGLKHVI